MSSTIKLQKMKLKMVNQDFDTDEKHRFGTDSQS